MSSKFDKSADLSIPQEYQDFMDKFDHVAYVAFGTIFMPSDEDMSNIVNAIKLSDPEKDGFIISLKENQLNYKVL